MIEHLGDNLIIIVSTLGAGCIWNDILDREFDRQVGKNC
jgi:4-hydroxybenzoate polyprenyltransferase